MLRTTLGLLLFPFVSLSLAHHPWAPLAPRQDDTAPLSVSSLLSSTASSASLSSSGAATPSATPISDPTDATGADTDKIYDVIVLGGGIAGISAARTLILSHNISNILLLEARSELGGRAHTEYLTNADGEQVTVEKGCNWIQGPGKEVIQDLADKWGLESTPTNYSDVVFFQGEWSEEEEDVQGEEAQGRKGKFLSDEEAKVFTEGYDAFLEAAPGYSGESTIQLCETAGRAPLQTGSTSLRPTPTSISMGISCSYLPSFPPPPFPPQHPCLPPALPRNSSHATAPFTSPSILPFLFPLTCPRPSSPFPPPLTPPPPLPPASLSHPR